MEDQEVLLELIKTGQKQTSTNHSQLMKSHEKIHTRIDKHETRIGRLELWRAGLVGGLGLIGIVGTAILAACKAWGYF